MPNVHVGQGMKLQMGGSQDTPLSGKDLCLSCHATVHSLLKKRKPGELLAEALDGLCANEHFKVYPRFPPAMGKGCQRVTDSWEEDEKVEAALSKAPSAPGERHWEDVREKVCRASQPEKRALPRPTLPPHAPRRRSAQSSRAGAPVTTGWSSSPRRRTPASCSITQAKTKATRSHKSL